MRYAIYLCLALLPATAVSQTAGKGEKPFEYIPELHVRSANNAIAVIVERVSGQFYVETREGVPILFSRSVGVTSFTNVRFNGITFTNNNLRSPGTPFGTVRMPPGTAVALSDRVVYKTVMRAGRDSLELTQEFIPDLVKDFAFIHIRTTLRNISRTPVPAGHLLMYDLFVGGTDILDFEAGGALITREREWRGAEMPEKFEGQAAGNQLRVRGRLGGAGVDAPDQFVVGRWQYNGYLGSAAWNYPPSGLKWHDNAVLLQWDETMIDPGNSVTKTTEYGYLTRFDASLTCNAGSVTLNPAESGYDPDPLTVSATVRNTGITPIPALSVEIALPQGVVFAAGETPSKTSSTPLPPNDIETFTWRVHVLPADTHRIENFIFELKDPAMVAQSCEARLPVPPIPSYSASLLCPDTILLALSANKQGYDPNPFQITASVRNTGTGSLSALIAAISLPPELRLLSGSSAVPVTPLPLLPGQVGTAVWLVEALPQRTAMRVTYSINLNGSGIAGASCAGEVELPATEEIPPCVQNGAATRGTEFWVVFPFNGGSSPKILRLFLVTFEETNIRVEQPASGPPSDITVPANTVRVFDVDPDMERMSPEITGNRGVRVVSDKEISVYAGTLMERHSDASLVLPVQALGTSYITAGYNYFDTDEQFVILATEDETEVTITPYGMTSTRRPPRVPYTVTLDRMETYQVLSGIMGAFGGLAGSIIESNKPVAVFSGARTGWIPENNRSIFGFLNPHVEQLPPLNYLGSDYALLPFLSRNGGDTWKVIATQDSTSVTLDGVQLVFLPLKGDRHEFMLDKAGFLQATRPVLVAQFSNSAAWDDEDNEYGDASMTIHTPVNRFAACHQFPSGLLPESAPAANHGLLLQPGAWIEVPDNPAIAVPVFTAECWINIQSGSEIVSRWAPGGDSSDWRLSVNMLDGRITFSTGLSSQQQHFHTAAQTIRADRWYHLALAADGPQGKAVLYVDGSPAINASFQPRQFEAVTGLAWGGVYDDASAANMRATFDEVRYWARVRTEAEIRSSMYRRLKPDDRNGLVGYWSFCGSISDSSIYRHITVLRNNPRIVQIAGFPSDMNCDPNTDTRSFVNLVVPDGGQNAVTVNGAPPPAGTFSPIASGTYYGGRVEVPGGMTRIETSDRRGVGVTSYGFAYHDAYSFNSCFLLHDAPSAPTGTGREGVHPEEHGFMMAPNPARNHTTLFFRAVPGNTVDVEVHDALGRAVMHVRREVNDAGRRNVRLDLSALPPGAYNVTLISGDGFFHGRLVVAR